MLILRARFNTPRSKSFGISITVLETGTAHHAYIRVYDHIPLNGGGQDRWNPKDLNSNQSSPDIPFYMFQLLSITTSFLTGVGMLALAVSFFITAKGLTTPSWLPIAAMSLSIFCTAAGFQPVPYVLISEMFNFRVSRRSSLFVNCLPSQASNNIKDFLANRQYIVTEFRIINWLMHMCSSRYPISDYKTTNW